MEAQINSFRFNMKAGLRAFREKRAATLFPRRVPFFRSKEERQRFPRNASAGDKINVNSEGSFQTSV